MKLKHDLSCSLLNSSRNYNNKKYYYDFCLKIQDNFIDNSLPWLNTEKEKTSDVKKMAEDWVKIFGDPNDPELLNKVEKINKYLENFNKR